MSEITVKVPLDDTTHRFLVRAMNKGQPIIWPGLHYREGHYLIQEIIWEDFSAWEKVVLTPVDDAA